MSEKEYIERGEAKKVLADDYAYAAAELLDTVPTADVVEVVRCKDCSFYEETDYFPDGKKRVCKLFNRQMQEDDFCSYGAKMDKE